MSSSNLRTVEQFVAANPAFTAGSLRWLIFNEHKNGLREAGAIVRIGSRVYIDLTKFDAWLATQQRKEN